MRLQGEPENKHDSTLESTSQVGRKSRNTGHNAGRKIAEFRMQSYGIHHGHEHGRTCCVLLEWQSELADNAVTWQYNHTKGWYPPTMLQHVTMQWTAFWMVSAIKISKFRSRHYVKNENKPNIKKPCKVTFLKDSHYYLHQRFSTGGTGWAAESNVRFKKWELLLKISTLVLCM